MIDRGDLAAEIGDNNLYNQTIKISKCTKSYGKLLIMATENLETMIFNNTPTKSEIISLSFSKCSILSLKIKHCLPSSVIISNNNSSINLFLFFLTKDVKIKSFHLL